jgi:RNA polymerase sigma factor (TIGR02999 family)
MISGKTGMPRAGSQYPPVYRTLCMVANMGRDLQAQLRSASRPEWRCNNYRPVWRVPMNDVTRILSAIEHGDPLASEQLLPLVYEELRKLAAARLAHEKPGQTLQATALVHDAYLRLIGPEEALAWNSRGHFFGAAAEAMRRILIDNARRKRAARRDGGGVRVSLEGLEVADTAPPDGLLALDEALSRLAAEDPRKAELVKLRFFAGLTIEEAAEALEISPATAKRWWTFARIWLLREVRGDAGGPGGIEVTADTE